MKKILLFLALSLCISKFYSSHILGGNISYNCIGNNTYIVSLINYEDCGTAFTSNNPNIISITNSCNSAVQQISLPNVIHQQIIPDCIGTIYTQCNGGTISGAYLHMWQDTIVLSDTCNYTFSHTSCCWAMPINISGSGNLYYWESNINNNSSSCNSSSIISTSNPIPTFCVNQPVTYNIDATNPDNNLLNYSLIDLMSSSGVSLPYQAGYSGPQPIFGITINSLTGELQFTPTITGNYVFSILIEEFDNSGNLLGSTIHDFTSYVISTPGCTNDPCPGCLPAYSEAFCATCHNGNNGAIVSSPQGSNGPWDILLIDPTSNTILNSYYDTLTTVVFHPLNSGEYIIRTIDSSGCSSDDSITICNPPELFLSLSNDTTICMGNSISISADINGGVFPYNYFWNNGSLGTTNYVTPLNTTSYFLTIEDNLGCSKQDSVTITVQQIPIINAGNDENICVYDTVQLTATSSGGVNYTWSPTDSLNTTNIANPLAWPVDTTIYVVTGTDTLGCMSTDTIIVHVNTVDSTTNVNGNVLSANLSGASYQWVDCDSNFAEIPGETDQYFTALNNGNYAVEITNNGCNAISNCINVFGIGVIENSFGGKFVIYPNPTAGELTIDLGKMHESIDAELFSIDGKMVSSYSFIKMSKLNLKIDQPAGYYLINIRSKSGNRAQIKILKN